MINNTTTHILCEPYEIEDYLNKNEINIDTFVQKCIDLISSIKNTNYENIEFFEELDSDTYNKILNIKIPNSFKSNYSIDKIYQYSNLIEIQKTIIFLKEKCSDIFNLKNNTDIDTVKEYIESFTETIDSIKNGEVYTEKTFETFGDISIYQNILSICKDSSLFDQLIQWITEFPNSLLDVQIDTIDKDEIIHNQRSYSVDSTNDDNSEALFVKRQILYLIYILYSTIVSNIIETKEFWNKFFDFMTPGNDAIDNEYVNDTMNVDRDIKMILNDLDSIEIEEDNDNLFGSESLYDPLFSLEDDDTSAWAAYGNNVIDSINPFKKGTKLNNKNPFKVAAEFFKAFPNKVNKIRKQFKMFRMRAKNHAFYMKYMGRIEGLYERYADEATITENGMKGDPVKILKEEGHEYISNVSNSFVDMQHGLVDISKKFAATGNPKEMFTILKGFAGMYMNDTAKSSSMSTNFETSLRFKMGEMITKGNKIYGYTPESIAENGKLPPSNHAIVSLFVDRPDEKPFDQKVSDIFKDTESFKLIAKNEKEPVFEVSMICSDLLTKGIQKEQYKNLSRYRKDSIAKFDSIIDDLVANDPKPKKAKRELSKQFKACWKSLLNGFNYVVKQKNYISDLISSYFIMMTRIDNLCKIAITSLLHVETDHKDESYKTGFKGDSLKSHKEYQQKSADEEGRQTKGEKERAKMEAAAERKAQYASKKTEMNNHINAIKKSMSLF